MVWRVAIKEICIVIPVFNNPLTLNSVVEDALEHAQCVVVVDDGSDSAVECLQERVHLLRHESNSGKGRAILSGAAKAAELGFDSFFVLDADAQHRPIDIGRFKDKDLSNSIIIGVREFGENVPMSSKFGRAFSNFWVYLETGIRLKDTQSGFRSYPISVLDFDFKTSRYDFEIEVLVKHLWRGGGVEEVDITVHYQKAGERVSHFDKLHDNIRLALLHTSLLLRFKRV